MASDVQFLKQEHPGAELQTDKDAGKIVTCNGCEQELIVNAFYAPAKARCSSCKGQTVKGEIASTSAPVPGRTDPATAVNLADCLINPAFASALCPVHPDDEEHEMELKSVSHSEYWGPGEWLYTKEGLTYQQKAAGESCLWQCLKCKATVAYSTTAQHQLMRQNEVRDANEGVNGWNPILGVRGKAEVA